MSFISAPLPYRQAIVTSLFGTTHGRLLPHTGVDFGVPSGTPVLAVMDGQVDKAENLPDLGGTVRITHTGRVATLYAHLTVWYVRLGQSVVAGQVIGLSGGGASDPNAGRSRGPHLHFEMQNGAGVPINPLPYLHSVLRMSR